MKNKTANTKNSTSAISKVSTGQKVLISVGLLAGAGAIAAGLGAFDYDAYKRKREFWKENLMNTVQTMQTAQIKTEYQRIYPSMLIKTSKESTLWYFGYDFKRHLFPNQDVYNSWFGGINQNIVTISESQMLKVELGDSVRFRPGSRPVKTQKDSKVYTVSKGGNLHWITTEPLMVQIFGPKWALKVADIPSELMSQYKVGESIKLVDSKYHPAKQLKAVLTIDQDLGIK